MEAKAISKYVRISCLKAREVAKEIQGLPVSAALDILNYTPKKAAHLFSKVLKSAVANAEHNFEMNVEALVIREATATTGPVLKRWKPMARGSAGSIRKPTAHLSIIVSDEIPLPEPKKRGGKKGAKAQAPATIEAETAAAE
jgi:large subunit ribosomal protein L22